MTTYKPRSAKQIDYQSIAEAIVRMAPAYRAPYVSVIGYSEALLEGLSGDLNDTQREDLASIRVCGWEALGNLNDILDVMLLVSGEIEYEIERLQAKVVFNDVIRDLHRTHVDATERVDVKADVAEDVFLNIDEMRLRQVILGLVGNALGTVPEARVIVAVSKAEDKVSVTIRDACQVANQDDYTYFFEPSWVCRLEDNHWRQMQWQTYLAHQFVTAFDGEIAVRGVPAQDDLPAGTLIAITFPLAAEAPVAEADKKDTKEKKATEASQPDTTDKPTT